VKLLGWTITRHRAVEKALQPVYGHGGWWNLIREPFAGAWQRNLEIKTDFVLTYSAVFACVTLIANDISKLRLRLVRQDADGIWQGTEAAAFSPVLRRPNRYQNRIQFFANWVTSKLVHGNAYILKERDQRGIVTALYILDPNRVRPLVADDGSIYYELSREGKLIMGVARQDPSLAGPAVGARGGRPSPPGERRVKPIGQWLDREHGW
jgi:Phage portal protein